MRSLDEIAAEYMLERRSGESDEALRKRVERAVRRVERLMKQDEELYEYRPLIDAVKEALKR